MLYDLSQEKIELQEVKSSKKYLYFIKKIVKPKVLLLVFLIYLELKLYRLPHLEAHNSGLEESGKQGFGITFTVGPSIKYVSIFEGGRGI